MGAVVNIQVRCRDHLQVVFKDCAWKFSGRIGGGVSAPNADFLRELMQGCFFGVWHASRFFCEKKIVKS
ncbi:MAG: hypothetical protein DME97_05470 [Verrucomicrobia bacterium]|nr:MAG: hypothetical protein DME97_05470 [Verrucomicrobiota bacterium]